jgi:hypothetical protein
MAQKIQPTIQTGAMTLVLLVNNYRSQMIALLLKNGVTVPNNASSQQIASLMANLLKVSKSFFKDLNNFIQNPKVTQTLAGGLTQTAQYFRASGSNFAGQREGNAQYFRVTSTDDDTETTTTPPKKGGFFSDLKLGDLISKGLEAFGSYDTNQTNRAIADARAKAGLPVLTEDELVEEKEKIEKDKTKDGLSTTTIVVLSLVGVAVLGTIIYFVARPKE